MLPTGFLGSEDKNIILTRVGSFLNESSDGIRVVLSQAKSVKALALAKDGTFFVSLLEGDKEVTIWNCGSPDGTVLPTVRRKFSFDSEAICFSIDITQRHIAIGLDNGTVVLFDLLTGESVSALSCPEPPASVCALFCSVKEEEDTKLLVAAYADGVIRVWNWCERTLVLRRETPLQSPCTSVIFSPDDSHIAFSTHDGRTGCWMSLDAAAKFFAPNFADVGFCHQVAFSPNRYWMATATPIKKVIDLETRTQLTMDWSPNFRTQEPACRCLIWSADGSTLFTGWEDGLIRCCDATSHSNTWAAGLNLDVNDAPPQEVDWDPAEDWPEPTA